MREGLLPSIRISAAIVMWEHRPHRCVFVRYAEPKGIAVQVWKYDETLCSVPCDDEESAALVAADLREMYSSS